MADNFEPLPEKTKLVDKQGMISRAWFQYFYKFFGNNEKRLTDLETQAADFETRIDALENP